MCDWRRRSYSTSSAAVSALHEAALVTLAPEGIPRTVNESREDLKASRELLEEQALFLDQEIGWLVVLISDLESRRVQFRIERDLKRDTLETQKEEFQQIEPQLAARLPRGEEEKSGFEARITRSSAKPPIWSS